MERYKVGETIQHKLWPGFTMTVLDVKDCDGLFVFSDGHAMYQAFDPEMNPEWFCADYVEKVNS